MKFTASTILSIPLLLTTITFAAPTPGDPNWCSTAAVDNAAPGSVAYNNAVEARKSPFPLSSNFSFHPHPRDQ